MFVMNSLRSAGLSSLKTLEMSSTKAFNSIASSSLSGAQTSAIRRLLSKNSSPRHGRSVRHPFEFSPVLNLFNTPTFLNRNLLSLYSPSQQRNYTMASNLARRVASRGPTRAYFSTAARSPPPRSVTPLLAAAGVVVATVAIATQEVGLNGLWRRHSDNSSHLNSFSQHPPSTSFCLADQQDPQSRTFGREVSRKGQEGSRRQVRPVLAS